MYEIYVPPGSDPDSWEGIRWAEGAGRPPSAASGKASGRDLSTRGSLEGCKSVAALALVFSPLLFG